MRSTSGCESGTGLVPAPTKPVTPGVPLTTVPASSDMFMLTRTYPGSTRFSICTFCPSFVSITCSVGTTTRRNRGDWFMDRMRCSRLVFTLFSCPEYVLITYQRNMPTSLQKDVADEGTDQLVDAPQIGTDDEHGNDDDDGSLDRLRPVRPVDLA